MSNLYEGAPLEEPFDHDYEIEWLMDLPNSPSVPRYSFPPKIGNAGVILRVTPKSGNRFLAIVDSNVENFRIMSWPDPNCLLVLHSAWLIDTQSPEESRELGGFDGHSVHYVYPFAKQNVVLIGHCCGISCYGSDGLLWERRDLFCCEDPSAIETDGNELLLTAEKHGLDSGPTVKRLELRTGKRLDISDEDWPVDPSGALDPRKLGAKQLLPPFD